jgi:hypothetical protein
MTIDSINMAGHLRSTASAGEIFVNRAIWQQVAEDFECTGADVAISNSRLVSMDERGVTFR